MKKIPIFTAIVSLALVLAACSTSNEGSEATFSTLSAKPTTYIVSSGGELPANFPSIVAANGDSLGAFHADAGFAVVNTRRPDVYSAFASTIVENFSFSSAEPEYEPVAFEADSEEPRGSKGKGGKPRFEEEADGESEVASEDDEFFGLQWGHLAVDAQGAWAAGSTGNGVRVAVLDSGFDLDHPDLAQNINLGLSDSMVEGEGLEYSLNDPFSHGTHVAGTIAAADNGLGTIGVAPDAELVLVKVLGDAGTGSFGAVIAGIIHAANVDADVINMSLGAIIFQGNGHPDAEGEEAHASAVAALRVAINRAITYANNSGATVIVSAGNEALDLNSPETSSLVNFNSFASNAISISALGPLGWALDPATSLDERAVYTNIGPEIDFSAPGGNLDAGLLVLDDDGNILPATPVCTVAGVTNLCYAFDFVFSTGSQDAYYWSAGTSMAAPHVSGIAALIIGQNGGDMQPSQVYRELRERAEDLGSWGQDDLHGYGRVRSGY